LEASAGSAYSFNTGGTTAGQSSGPDAHNGANGLANGAQTGPVSTDASIMAAVHAPQAWLDRDQSTRRAAWDAFWAEVGPQNSLS
jgi:hypothetical protein